MDNSVLRVENLSVRRDGQLVVDGVNFELLSESDTALVGPNGAGKSSLVAAVLGLLPRQTGEVWVLGHRLGPAGELPHGVRSQIAYLPQSFALQGRFPLSVAEFVAFGFDPPGPRLPWRNRSKRRAAVLVALARTGSSNLGAKLLSELSGG